MTAAIALVAMFAGLRPSAPAARAQSPAALSAEAVPASHYDLPFGPSPYLPSQASSDFLHFLKPQEIPSADYCAHCHAEVHKEWRQSAHANAFRAPWYRKNVDELGAVKGVAYTRHCESCHNPAALFTGALSTGSTVERPHDEDGITCMVCHSIQKVTDTAGTGGYMMGTPAVMLDASGKPVPGIPSDAEILAHLDRHNAAVMRPFYKQPEFCAACHKAAMPAMLNGYKWVRTFTTFDEWQQSSWSRETPLPFYEKPTTSTCQTCHMPAVPSKDPASVAGNIASHRWLGANTAIPTQYGYTEQLQQIINFLKADQLQVDIFALTVEHGRPTAAEPALQTTGFALERTGSASRDTVSALKSTGFALKSSGVALKGTGFSPYVQAGTKEGALAPEASTADSPTRNLIAPLGATDRTFAVLPGDWVRVDVVVRNKGIGHALVPELRDFYESWVDFQATADTGATVYRSGALGPDHRLDPDARSYVSRILSQQGQALDHHEMWKLYIKAYDATVLPGRSDVIRYRFRVPPGVKSIDLSAAVRYRRFNRVFSDWVFGDTPSAPDRFPTVTLASGSYGLKVGLNTPQPEPSLGSDLKPWMRWNNYGIGMLDRQQFAEACDAFQHVIALDPTYERGYVNVAIAEYSRGRFNDSLAWLDRALAMKPNDPRALYYKGLNFRWQVRYNEAVAALEPVAAAYPRFRQVHQELGYIYMTQHQYVRSRVEYEKVLAIDPDDQLTHRWLGGVLQAIGDTVGAAREAKLASQTAADPAAGFTAQRFWREHVDLASKAMPHHTFSEGNKADDADVQRILNLQNPPSYIWIEN